MPGPNISAEKNFWAKKKIPVKKIFRQKIRRKKLLGHKFLKNSEKKKSWAEFFFFFFFFWRPFSASEFFSLTFLGSLWL